MYILTTVMDREHGGGGEEKKLDLLKQNKKGRSIQPFSKSNVSLTVLQMEVVLSIYRH